MKKTISLLLASTLLLGALTGCGSTTATTTSAGTEASAGTTASGDKTVIKVGASITPHAEILAVAKDILADEGYDLQVVEFTDYVQPNTALEEGELDANYFQHKPYLDDFNEQNGTHLVSVAAIHYEPFGLYPGKTKTIADLKDGATIAIPNDGTNEARALYLLQDQGLITLKDDVGFTATVLDIADNPKNLNIKEVEAAQLTITLPDVDMAVINGNYALQGNLSVKNDAIATESADSESAQTYANIIAVKEGNENNPAILALVKALQSDKVRDFINNTYDGAVVPMF